MVEVTKEQVFEGVEKLNKRLSKIEQYRQCPVCSNLVDVEKNATCGCGKAKWNGKNWLVIEKGKEKEKEEKKSVGWGF